MLKVLRKRFRRLRLEVDRDLTRPIATADCRLVMTLLVRDEEDILEANLDFHLQSGVDFIIAMDNGSRDRSTEILRRYERIGRLRLLHQPDQTFKQHLWVNQMAQMAVEEHGADIVFHCDADEFWRPASGNLKTELLQRRRVDALAVPVRNVLMRNRGGAESFPQDAVFAVDQPFALPNGAPLETAWPPIYLRPHPPSLMFTTHRGTRDVRIGNHSLAKGELARLARSETIRIDHYPARGFLAFERKVQNAESLVKSESKEVIGWHWRQWYRALQAGRLKEEYKRLTLNDSEAEALIQSGRVSRVNPLTRPKQDLAPTRPAPAQTSRFSAAHPA